MIEDDLPEAVARAHAIHKMHLQAIGTLVVRQLVKDNAINIEKLEGACMDLRLVEVDENGKFTALPITIK